MRETVLKVDAGHKWPFKRKQTEIVRESRLKTVYEEYHNYEDKVECLRMLSYNLSNVE